MAMQKIMSVWKRYVVYACNNKKNKDDCLRDEEKNMQNKVLTLAKEVCNVKYRRRNRYNSEKFIGVFSNTNNDHSIMTGFGICDLSRFFDGKKFRIDEAIFKS